MSKKVLITGINGLLGQKLAVALQGRNDLTIIGTGKGTQRVKNTPENFTYESCDLSDRIEVLRMFEKVKPDYLIHGAAMTNVDQCELEPENCDKANVDATAFLIEACQQHHTFFQLISTDFIFSGKEGPLDENAKPDPVNYYGESKLKAENLLKGSGLKYAILRTVLVYGLAEDLSRSNIVLWVKGSLEGEKDIQVVDDQWRSPTLAEDLAIGAILTMDQEAEGIFNIAGPDFISPYQMAIQVAEVLDLDKKFIHKTDSTKFSQPAKRPMITGLKVNKAKEKLGYNPRSFAEGVALLADQLKKIQDRTSK